MANKRLFLILPLILTLALAACAGPPAEPTQTSQSTSSILAIEKGDYLIYMLRHSGKGNLYFYDPATDTHIPILPDWETKYFAVSTKDQIAFSVLDENTETYDTYILDYPYWENTPLNITNTPETNEIAHSWSPDGKYLVLEIYSDETDILTVWDGNQFFQIHELINGRGFGFTGIDWSQSGKLVFAENGNPQSSRQTTEIFVWDGNPNHTAFNITQTIKHEAHHPTWSPSDQLAFHISYGNQNFGIMVWDGNITSDDSVDDSAFTEIGRGLVLLYSYPTWTNEGLLAFESNGRMYQWDGEETIKIKNVWRFGWAVQSWAENGAWASVNASWDYPNRLYIHNQNNKVILKTEGRYTPAWSPDNKLAFCVYNHDTHTFTISIWDNFEMTEIIEYEGYITAKWRNGESIYCSNG